MGVLPTADATYRTLLADLRAIIAAGRGRAAVAINAEMVTTYWRMGERIVREEQAGKERAGYGERLLAQLGRALSQEFGRAFSARNLSFMRQFYLAYPILCALRSELAWTHYRTLMRLPDNRRDFYGRMAVSGRWSSRELERQIGSMLYERTALFGNGSQPNRTRRPAKADRPASFRRGSAARFCKALGILGTRSQEGDGDIETVLTLPGHASIPDPALAEIVRRLVEAFQPERIYLFGSKARGDAGPDSDYDLMVLVPETRELGYRLAQRAHSLLWDTGTATDVLVWSEERFQSRLQLHASLPATIGREGRLVYAA